MPSVFIPSVIILIFLLLYGANAECLYAKCHYSECLYAKCHFAERCFVVYCMLFMLSI
jgi:hypothetical protein